MEHQRNARLESEAEFFDHEYAGCQDLLIQEKMFKKYQFPRNQPIEWREWGAYLLGDINRKILLEYGCGFGEEATYFAKLGAQVFAIDISKTGVEITRQRAKANNLEDKISAEVMDAMATTFEAEKFDLIYGIGILHHLNLEKAIAEIHRLLRRGGRAVFLEPVDNSILMAVLKKLIPVKKVAVTDDERNLTYQDIEKFKTTFHSCHYWEFFFLARLRKIIRNAKINDFLYRIDYHIFKNLKFMRKYGSGVVIELIK